MNFETLRKICFAFGQSLLQYGITAWGSAYKTLLKKIETAQKILLKIALFKPYHFSTKETFASFQVLDIRQLYVRSVIIYMHKYKKSTSNNNCNNIFTRAYSRQDSSIPFMKFKLTQHCLLYIGPKLYNLLPVDIKNATMMRFKYLIKKWIISNHSYRNII